jgi:GDP-mannose transporter
MSDDKKSDDYGVGSARGSRAPSPVTRQSKSSGSVTENPVVAILSYCFSSILMTVTNKYVLSGRDFNLNFFLLCVQSVVCVLAISICKATGVITYRDFNSEEAKKCTWKKSPPPLSLPRFARTQTDTPAKQGSPSRSSSSA